MENIKKYLIGFMVGIMSIGTVVYAADNGSIGALFEQLGSGKWVLDGNNIKDITIGSGKLIDNSVSSNVVDWLVVGNTCNGMACVGYCLNSVNDIVGMKWMNNIENYDECFNSESGSLIKIITYYK